MRLTIFLLSSLLLFGCNENRVFTEHQDLSPDVEWKKEKKLTFKIPVDDTETKHNLLVAFRFAQGFQFSALRIKITETSPSGNVLEEEYAIQVVGEDGDYMGEAGLDIWDLEQVVQSNRKFAEKGTYTFVVENTMPVDPLNYAMELGLVLDKVPAK